MVYSIDTFPAAVELETTAVLKKLAVAHRFLANLKGVAETIPNESILINTLSLQEAKDSSAIENIITTHDDLYKAQLFQDLFDNAAAKEVSNYANALKEGFELVRENKILSLNYILQIQRTLEQNDAGLRKLPGTALVNQSTGKIVYTPPQHPDKVEDLMRSLVTYINQQEENDPDPLIKMAIIHHQFESIHPFYDGNGRTGRIINILYLVMNDLLDLPVLYLSRFIIRHKRDYYRLLQEVREKGNWTEWVLFVLTSIEETAKETIVLITEMRKLMQDYKHRIRNELPKIYSQDLLNNLFRHPYTKIEFLMNELKISRITATKYLNLLVEHRFLTVQKLKKTNFYINPALYDLLKGDKTVDQPAPPVITITPDDV